MLFDLFYYFKSAMTIFILNVMSVLMSSNPFDVLFPYLLTGEVSVFCSDCGLRLHPVGEQLVGADLVLFHSLGELGSGRDLKQSRDITRITVNCSLNFYLVRLHWITP